MILEYVAFFVGFRYYVFLKRRTVDPIESVNRLSIILGAVVGAFLGSRIMGYLEHPITDINQEVLVQILNSKTIMGGLFGGLIGVEIAKKIIGEKNSSGDLFTLPLIVGIFIGRIGCFLSGTNEFTYGSETSFFMGMNLGDGVLRHPITLYELIFLIGLFFVIRTLASKTEKLKNGDLFKLFMLSYFGFRFLIEFLKPNVFFVFGLSSIQWLCIICWIYYFKSLKKFFR
ncbi:MAG: prolipoprotein diacylglyceryl transferase [Flavobacteriales bacterium]|nr:prolipoprotein diacylglyceryl transferase [Flavobacteriales bacterium]